jgi:hypothetical protein
MSHKHKDLACVWGKKKPNKSIWKYMNW